MPTYVTTVPTMPRWVKLDAYGNFTVEDDPNSAIAVGLLIATAPQNEPKAMSALAPEGEGLHVQGIGAIDRVWSREGLPAPLDEDSRLDPEKQELWRLFKERDHLGGAASAVLSGDELRELVARAIGLRSRVEELRAKVVYFVSGHLDVSAEEFAEHYAPKLLAAARDGASFVVGDARGCDAMVQAQLQRLNVERERVRVFHMFESPRNNVGAFPTVGGFKSDDERDCAMTEASTADIGWVRPGREKSGTAKNLARRR